MFPERVRMIPRRPLGAARSGPEAAPPVAEQAVSGQETAVAGTGPYRVGNCRPPLETRFRKGQSGNPKGRPKGTRNTATLLSEKLDEKVGIRTPDGRQKKMSKREIGVTKLVNRFAETGEAKLFELLHRHEPAGHREAVSPTGLFAAADAAEVTPDDQAILDWYVETRRRSTGE